MATKKTIVFVPFEVVVENNSDYEENLKNCFKALADDKYMLIGSGYYSVIKKKCKVSDLQIIKPK